MEARLCRRSELRTVNILDSLFCSFIVGVYIPQYISIIRHGTRGIASRYILFHYLFSICTLGQRVSHNNFYKAHWVRVIFLAGPPVTRAVVILRYEAVQIKLLNYQDRLTDKNSTRNERYFETEHVWGH